MSSDQQDTTATLDSMNHQAPSQGQQQQMAAMLRAAQDHQQQQQQGDGGGGGGGGGGGLNHQQQQQLFHQQQQQHSNQQQLQQHGFGGMGGMGGNNNAAMAAMMQQHQQQQSNMFAQQSDQQQQLQQQQGNNNGGGGFDIGSELKRIQQLHQLGGTGGTQGNALLMTGNRSSNDPSASFMQSLFDQQQKVQAPRFDNPLSQNLGAGMSNPLLQPSFLQDARLLMAQNQFNAATLQQHARQQQEVPLPSPHSLFHRDGSRRMRGGVIEPFPEKLHRLLTEVEAAGRSDVISFVANGRAFAIHKPDKFFKEIVPLYFRQSRLSSFKRQLNLYGFELINSGPARGGYFHELFVKDHPEMCRRMRRVAVKVGTKDGKDVGAPPVKEPSSSIEKAVVGDAPEAIADTIGGSIEGQVKLEGATTAPKE